MEDRLRPNWFDREAGALRIVDQTLLPGEVQYRELKTAEEVWTAIRILQVRGAPAIGGPGRKIPKALRNWKKRWGRPVPI